MGLPDRQSFDYEPLLSRAGQLRKSVVFRKRQVIFCVGERSDSLYFISHGSAKLTVTSAEGREAVLGIRRSGDFFGEEVMDVDGLPRGTNAIALGEMSASRIDRNTMLGLLHFDQDLWRVFNASLIRLMAQVNEKLADSLLYSSEKRLARVLVSLARPPKATNENDYRTIEGFSQQDLANMIGVTRQRANCLMKRFRKLGFIDYYSDGLRVHKSIRSITGRSWPVI